MSVQYPVHRLTYKCCGCDSEYTQLGSDEEQPRCVDSSCCTYRKALLINNEEIEDPSWQQIKRVYAS